MNLARVVYILSQILRVNVLPRILGDNVIDIRLIKKIFTYMMTTTVTLVPIVMALQTPGQDKIMTNAQSGNNTTSMTTCLERAVELCNDACLLGNATK